MQWPSVTWFLTVARTAWRGCVSCKLKARIGDVIVTDKPKCHRIAAGFVFVKRVTTEFFNQIVVTWKALTFKLDFFILHVTSYNETKWRSYSICQHLLSGPSKRVSTSGQTSSTTPCNVNTSAVKWMTLHPPAAVRIQQQSVLLKCIKQSQHFCTCSTHSKHL